ncbi:CopD family protein [Roseovarius sp. D0-M9]|uniref:CopD family protein n=1 Tax=Roseovarius sp. D0-M9 TaxID=3127117 RepID=UPI00300F7FA7
MNELAKGLIPHFKGLHIAALIFWCGGLAALPLMLSLHDKAASQADFTRIRHITHFSYVFAITPAALVAIGSGTALIFLREAYVPWLFAKLVFVALLVAFHAWIGGILTRVAESAGQHVPPKPVLPLILLLVPVLAILALVLGKPDLHGLPMPEWLTQTQDGQLPFAAPKP